MLARIELDILATVEDGDTVGGLANKLAHSESYCSRGVAELAGKGLVHTVRSGREKRIIPSDASAVERYRDLVHQYPHIDFSDLLTGKTMEVLYHLDRPRTVSDLADRSDNYRNTVNRVLTRLRQRGLVGTTDGHYHFTGDFDRLHDFAVDLVHHLHRQRLETVAPKGTILWESYDEFLAQTETVVEAAGFHETGLRRFAAYGLPFLVTRQRYYFYSETMDGVSPAALCCHTVLIHDDTRHRSYCLLLLSAVDVDEDDLRDHAAKYGLEEEIGELLLYLESEGGVESDRLPPWEEFQVLAREYGVTVAP